MRAALEASVGPLSWQRRRRRTDGEQDRCKDEPVAQMLPTTEYGCYPLGSMDATH